MEKIYAVYSHKQSCSLDGRSPSNQPIVFEYEKPDGSKVLVTEVGPEPGCPNSKWDDKVDLGEVTRFIRIVRYSVFYP